MSQPVGIKRIRNVYVRVECLLKLKKGGACYYKYEDDAMVACAGKTANWLETNLFLE